MEQPTAVIAEDELLFAQALTAFLEDLGYQVLATADSEEGAVRVVCERRPDVVLMDLKLLDGNGVGAAIMIRENFKVPIIFLTFLRSQRCNSAHSPVARQCRVDRKALR